MGDRVNIVMQYDGDKNKRVFFYGHWAGDYALPALHRALAKHWRWEDDAYLARIIFCEFVKGQEAEETGFGISLGICDNEHPLIVVDIDAKTIHLEHREPTARSVVGPPQGKVITFDDFVTLKKPGWKSFGV